MKKTVLRRRKIAVVSVRRSISDFFRLEAESCSCFVSVMSMLPSDISEYDVIILDDDGSYSGLGEFKNLYRISSERGDPCENILSWPVSVSRVREIFEGYVTDQITETPQSIKQILYLYNGKEKAVVYKNKRIVLTESEWKVLDCLARSFGEAVSRETLRKLFDTEDGNITDVYICHLRRKLEDPFGRKIIRTLRSKGYMLTVDAIWK